MHYNHFGVSLHIETNKQLNTAFMDKLASTSKVTMATLKSFAKRNETGLFVKEESSFDGMVDCVMELKGSKFIPTVINEKTNYWKLGIEGIYTVGSSRDRFQKYEDEKFVGIQVTNSCGRSILAIKKQA